MPIPGGGRVGRAAASALQERGITFRIVEKNPDRVKLPEHTIIGSAADYDVLLLAVIEEAPTVMVTTSDDTANIHLTIDVRRLRPSVQIISRANLERNVSKLHRAGADFVMSYTSRGATAVFNIWSRTMSSWWPRGSTCSARPCRACWRASR